MQVSIQTTSGLERRLTVGVPAERIESEVNARLQKAVGTLRLDGFRPGKVPMKVVKQRFGAGVRQEVLGEVMSQSFYEAVTQEKLRPAGQPQIEPKKTEAGQDLEYVATFEVFPEVELRDYSSVKVVKPVAEVVDVDVDKMIDTLRDQQGTWQQVERAAADGDQVNIDYAGTKDGEAFDGGSAEGSDLVIGSNSMIPGFEDGVIGMKADEEKVLALVFPEDYQSEELKGAAVEFKVKINTISERQTAELNDELFEKFGVKDGGEEQFRKEVAQNMSRELKNAVKGKVKGQVMDALLEVHEDLQIPQSLEGQEIGVLRGQMLQQFGGAADKIDAQSLLPDEMFKDQANRRVKLGLILNEYISKEDITADPAKVKETIEGFASTYEDPEEVVNYYYGNQEQLQQVEAMVIEDSVIEKLLEQVEVSENTCSYEEAIAPEPSSEGAD
jgi:trigger factor